jgi:hypothetical protein
MCSTWVLTVASLMNSRAAASRFELPRAIRPNPTTSATGSPNTPISAAFSRWNSLPSTTASRLKPLIFARGSAARPYFGRPVGAQLAGRLDRRHPPFG